MRSIHLMALCSVLSSSVGVTLTSWSRVLCRARGRFIARALSRARSRRAQLWANGASYAVELALLSGGGCSKMIQMARTMPQATRA